jgi:hypothetical protein
MQKTKTTPAQGRATLRFELSSLDSGYGLNGCCPTKSEKYTSVKRYFQNYTQPITTTSQTHVF